LKDDFISLPAKKKCSYTRWEKVRVAEAYSLYVAAKRTEPNAVDGCFSFAGRREGDSMGDIDYDVVVVGAGNGGLTASAALAQKGLDVLLLERHNIPGGCATSFCRGRFEFEVALHQLSGMGTDEKPGPLRMTLGNLGILDDLEFVEMSDLYRVVAPDGFEITLRADRKQVVEELQRQFPGEKKAIEEFFDLVYSFANQMLSAFYLRDPEASREKYPVLYQYALRTCKEVLDNYFTDPRLKAVLSVYWGYLGLPPNRLSFAYLCILFFAYIEYKPFHLKGGSQALSNAIANRFVSSGGTARFNCGVQKILTDKGAVKGVVTDQGETIHARYVVSNVSPVATYLQLMDQENVPGGVMTEMRGRSLGPSAFVVWMGFDCEPEEIGITESTNFVMTHTDIADLPYNQMQQVEMDDELMVLSCYDVSDPEFSPEGTCQVNLVTLKFGEPWLRVPPGEYHKTKHRCAEAMLRTMEKIHPNLRQHIEEMEVATPLTCMRYLGHPNGSIYGFEQQTKDSLFFRPGKHSPVQGLYFASGWGDGCGFQPTLEAGESVAKSILKTIDGQG